jgi:hypothetical protein
MKIRPVAAELFHVTDGRSDKSDEANSSLFVFTILQMHRKMFCSCRETNNTNWNTDVGCPAPNSAPPCLNVWSMSLVLQHYVTAAERHRSLFPSEILDQLGLEHAC